MVKDFHSKWYADYGLYIGAGGGGAADDGSGFVYKPHFLLGHRLSPRAGFKCRNFTKDFPTRNLKDVSLLPGLNWNAFQYFQEDLPTKEHIESVEGSEKKQQIHVIHLLF